MYDRHGDGSTIAQYRLQGGEGVLRVGQQGFLGAAVSAGLLEALFCFQDFGGKIRVGGNAQTGNPAAPKLAHVRGVFFKKFGLPGAVHVVFKNRDLQGRRNFQGNDFVVEIQAGFVAEQIGIAHVAFPEHPERATEIGSGKSRHLRAGILVLERLPFGFPFLLLCFGFGHRVGKYADLLFGGFQAVQLVVHGFLRRAVGVHQFERQAVGRGGYFAGGGNREIEGGDVVFVVGACAFGGKSQHDASRLLERFLGAVVTAGHVGLLEIQQGTEAGGDAAVFEAAVGFAASNEETGAVDARVFADGGVGGDPRAAVQATVGAVGGLVVHGVAAGFVETPVGG